jgi:hypothetical protein
MADRSIRIANFSGALGDYTGALADAVNGEAVDVVVGDYLAEMTMARIAAGFAGAEPGTNSGLRQYYVPIFARQLSPLLPEIAARGIKVVVNAGAFNPAGLADSIRRECRERGIALSVAHVLGDDVFDRIQQLAGEGQLRNLDTGAPLGELADRLVAANAYLGCWGIAAALGAGADIVICGRVTDASLVMGPAAWWHDWQIDDWDALAGALAAGHVIECGPQAQGGNFAGFTEIDAATRLGFPIAEIAADGSSVITKRADEGGSVTVDTVTAQLVYEIQGTTYLNPDVTLHLETVMLDQIAKDRVRISGSKGSPPSPLTKVGCFYPNGWATTLFGYATGTDVDAKIDWLRRQMQSIADGLALDDYHFDALGRPADNPASQAEATVAIRIAASAAKRSDVGRVIAGFTSFGLGGIPGFHGDVAGAPAPRTDYWPGLIRQADLAQQVILDDGRILEPPLPPAAAAVPEDTPSDVSPGADATGEPATLGDFVYARSGDKGANASLGLWARNDEGWDFLKTRLGTAELASLLGLREEVAVERYLLPNVRAALFILKGYFGVSGSGNIGLDQVGKALGEFARARTVIVAHAQRTAA